MSRFERLSLPPARTAVRVAGLALVALLTTAGSCGDEELQDALSGDAATSGTILSAVSRTQTDTGTVGALTPDAQPNGPDANFTVTLTPSSNAVTNGGTASMTVSAPTAFTEVYVGANGLSGFYTVTLPAATTSVTIQPTVDQDYVSPTITFQVSVGDGVTTGPIAEAVYGVIVVGTGDIQVSLTFSQQDDVDLAVVDPNGDEVFFGDREIPSGGELDLDANPICLDPRGNAENITWPTGSAIPGNYDVYVTLFDNCVTGPVDYTVTVSVTGQEPFLVNGTFQDTDIGLRVLVASFMVTP